MNVAFFCGGMALWCSRIVYQDCIDVRKRHTASDGIQVNFTFVVFITADVCM